jgi:type I site-specific restriction-modification system R (restriction) subunit
VRIKKSPKKKKEPVKITDMLNAKPILNEAHKQELDNIRNGVYSLAYDVVKDLPTEIQIEILNDKISKNKKKEKVVQQPVEPLRPKKKKKQDEGMMFRSLNDCTEEIRSVLTEWMNYEDDQNDDVFLEMLLQCINQLICGERNLESGARVLKMLRRMALKHPAGRWHEFFNKTLRYVNDQVLPRSGLCDTIDTKLCVEPIYNGDQECC